MKPFRITFRKWKCSPNAINLMLSYKGYGKTSTFKRKEEEKKTCRYTQVILNHHYLKFNSKVSNFCLPVTTKINYKTLNIITIVYLFYLIISKIIFISTN